MKQHKFGTFAFIIFLLIAGAGDLLSLIPFVGAAIAPLYFLLLNVYLWQTGHGILNARKLIAQVISLVGEMLPLIQALPTLIFATVAVFILSRLEEKTGISVKSIIKPGAKSRPPRLPQQIQAPLNQNGVRAPRPRGIPPPLPRKSAPAETGDIVMTE